ncbi:hypothetical protein ATL17_0699 [Maritalea mobilis]|uniref:Uncharacterized protein n=1 Tax=Maritalea mobilis TaxID=483324 RepID=A0A4R6VVB7_9HYPH|nr:hypothetical protein ATL17_0699 [Maritalea mobilis]
MDLVFGGGVRDECFVPEVVWPRIKSGAAGWDGKREKSWLRAVCCREMDCKIKSCNDARVAGRGAQMAGAVWITGSSPVMTLGAGCSNFNSGCQWRGCRGRERSERWRRKRAGVPGTGAIATGGGKKRAGGAGDGSDSDRWRQEKSQANAVKTNAWLSCFEI